MNQCSRVRQQHLSLKTTLTSLFGLFLSLFSLGSAQVQIDYWDMVWGPPEYIDTAKALVDQFNQEHPDIQVTYTSVPWTNWYQTYVTAVGSGTAPCASTGAGYQAAQLSDFGAIRPMDDFIEELRASSEADDFTEGTIDTLQYNGHYVALPWGFDIRVWYYRKDLLDAAGIAVPTNWEELKAAAIALTQDDTYGLVVPSDTLGTHNLYTLILNNGGALFTEDGQLDFTSERNLEALQFFADLVNEGAVHPASAGYDAWSDGPCWRRGGKHCRVAAHRRATRRHGHDSLGQQHHDVQPVRTRRRSQDLPEVVVTKSTATLDRRQ